jgi:hypothetical protein
VTPVNPSTVAADPIDNEYPGREATVQASIIGLLPTPELRGVALLATLRTEVAQRSSKEHTTTVALCLPATELISIDAMASVDTVVWWCRLCDQHGPTTTRPTAHSEGIEHLSAEHHAAIGTAP